MIFNEDTKILFSIYWLSSLRRSETDCGNYIEMKGIKKMGLYFIDHNKNRMKKGGHHDDFHENLYTSVFQCVDDKPETLFWG